MPTLHLICGLPGSGKTTLARSLSAQTNAIWLSPDEWLSPIVGDGYDERRRAIVEEMQWELAQRLLGEGVSVILDNGFWSRLERDSRRGRAHELGAAAKVHFLDVPLAELERRLLARNDALPPYGFPVEVSDLRNWYKTFEPPLSEELDEAP